MFRFLPGPIKKLFSQENKETPRLSKSIVRSETKESLLQRPDSERTSLRDSAAPSSVVHAASSALTDQPQAVTIAVSVPEDKTTTSSRFKLTPAAFAVFTSTPTAFLSLLSGTRTQVEKFSFNVFNQLSTGKKVFNIFSATTSEVINSLLNYKTLPKAYSKCKEMCEKNFEKFRANQYKNSAIFVLAGSSFFFATALGAGSFAFLIPLLPYTIYKDFQVGSIPPILIGLLNGAIFSGTRFFGLTNASERAYNYHAYRYLIDMLPYLEAEHVDVVNRMLNRAANTPVRKDNIDEQVVVQFLQEFKDYLQQNPNAVKKCKRYAYNSIVVALPTTIFTTATVLPFAQNTVKGINLLTLGNANMAPLSAKIVLGLLGGAASNILYAGQISKVPDLLIDILKTIRNSQDRAKLALMFTLLLASNALSGAGIYALTESMSHAEGYQDNIFKDLYDWAPSVFAAAPYFAGAAAALVNAVLTIGEIESFKPSEPAMLTGITTVTSGSPLYGATETEGLMEAGIPTTQRFTIEHLIHWDKKNTLSRLSAQKIKYDIRLVIPPAPRGQFLDRQPILFVNTEDKLEAAAITNLNGSPVGEAKSDVQTDPATQALLQRTSQASEDTGVGLGLRESSVSTARSTAPAPRTVSLMSPGVMLNKKSGKMKQTRTVSSNDDRSMVVISSGSRPVTPAIEVDSRNFFRPSSRLGVFGGAAERKTSTAGVHNPGDDLSVSPATPPTLAAAM